MDTQRKKYTVLLLSAPIGSGHKLAAEAIGEILRQKADVEVIHGNIFDFFPGFLGRAFLRSYLWILSKCPWLYELAYKWGDKQGGSLWLRSLLNRLLAKLGSSFLNKVHPDAVIATHATPAGIMCYYKGRYPQLWLGAVVTDFTVHRWWLCEGVDTYFIADERLRSKITMTANVQAFGIPVRQEFLRQDREKNRCLYGWHSREKVCLLMGGGEGLLPMENIVQSLMQEKIPQLKIVAITGRNTKLAALLQKNYANNDNIEIYGFREDIPAMMSAADMVITKAGGLTSAEVLASHVDFIIYKPLPGQEEGNADFLKRFYHAQVAKDVPSLIEAVKLLCGGDSGKIAKPVYEKADAVEKICEYVIEKLNSKK